MAVSVLLVVYEPSMTMLVGAAGVHTITVRATALNQSFGLL
jgi:hypothetical protein